MLHHGCDIYTFRFVEGTGHSRCLNQYVVLFRTIWLNSTACVCTCAYAVYMVSGLCVCRVTALSAIVCSSCPLSTTCHGMAHVHPPVWRTGTSRTLHSLALGDCYAVCFPTVTREEIHCLLSQLAPLASKQHAPRPPRVCTPWSS